MPGAQGARHDRLRFPGAGHDGPFLNPIRPVAKALLRATGRGVESAWGFWGTGSPSPVYGP